MNPLTLMVFLLVSLLGPPQVASSALPDSTRQHSLFQTFTAHYRYDAAGRLKEVAYDEVFRVHYTYDASGNLIARITEPGGPTDVGEEAGLITRFALHAGYPNPFNPTTTIPFDVKTSVRVVLRVYDVLGREVATLVDQDYPPGRHKFIFSARSLPSGIYFYRIEMGSFRAVRMLLLVR